MSISGIANKVSSTVQNVASKVADSAKQVASSIKDKVESKDNSSSSATKSAHSDTSSASTSTEDSVEISDQAKHLTDKADAYDDNATSMEDRLDEDGITEERVTVNGTDGDDTIDITINKDGSYTVVVNGEESTYSSEEAQQLFVDGGEGNDIINVHQEAKSAGAPTSGGIPSSILETLSKLGPTGATSEGSVDSASDGTISGGTGSDEVHVRDKSGIVINGGDGNDVITADDTVKNNLYINGGKGDDTIVGGSGNDMIVDNYGSNNIDGGNGNDTIYAMGRNSEKESGIKGFFNRLFGNADQQGNTINGGKGSDTIVTGDGDDIITDEYGNNTIVSNDGNDTITTGDGNDTIYSGDGDDNISSTGGSNTIYSGNGNDTIIGGSGRDFISGDKGNDIIYGNGEGDVIYAGDGKDYVDGGEGNDFVNAGSGDDEVHGGDGKDVIFGLGGNDKLYGDGDEDVIASGNGKDTIDGGDGNDTIRYTQGLFRGTDTILNQEDGDDVQKLNPISVPSNFVCDPSTTQAFKSIINDNLEAFACIEPGQAMLTEYAATGHTITFTSTSDANGYASTHNQANSVANITHNEDGTRDYTTSSGADSTVKINPAFISFSDNTAWKDQNTMIIMAHEMAHAYNNATGTKDYDFYNSDTGEFVAANEDILSTKEAKEKGLISSREVTGAELQAVGIYDENLLYTNPYGITENDYRDYFNMPLREHYIAPKK